MNQRFLMWGLTSIAFLVTLAMSSWHDGLWTSDATPTWGNRPAALASAEPTALAAAKPETETQPQEQQPTPAAAEITTAARQPLFFRRRGSQ